MEERFAEKKKLCGQSSAENDSVVSVCGKPLRNRIKEMKMMASRRHLDPVYLQKHHMNTNDS